MSKLSFFLRNAACIASLSIVIVTTLSGCLEKNLYDEDQSKKGDIEEVNLDNYFNYFTTNKVLLDINYGKDCPKVYFEVYAENPLVFQEEGAQVLKKEDLIPIATGFTDGKGIYSHQVVIPASVSEVYIYSGDFGVPTLFKSEVTNGEEINAKITFDNEIDLATLPFTRNATTRLATPSSIANIIPNTLGDWSEVGLPDYLNDEKKMEVDATLKSYITTYFPNKNNSGSSFISDNADVLIKENAHVTINYFGGATSARSIFAYYCYKDGASTDEIKQAVKHACVVFPNAHSAVLGNYSGVAVDLKYIDESGTFPSGEKEPTIFPANTKIGFLLWNNGMWGTNVASKNTFYSTKFLNSDRISHTAIFGAKDAQGKKYNIITMEDWNDKDYNDVAFVISSDPVRAIEVPDAENPGDRTGTSYYRGLLAFEDNWPSHGDYDMNDVVMKYVSNVDYNSDNNVLNITDKFTLLWSGAEYHNAFAYEVPYDLSKAEVQVLSSKGEDHYSIHGNVITLFTDAKAELGVSDITAGDMPSADVTEVDYKVSIRFGNPTLQQAEIVAPYNPFIRLGKAEVHLVNYKPTDDANNHFPSGADISNGVLDGTYYISKDGYPFAIHMDARTDESLMNLDLKKEGVRIDETYPKFAEWVKTRNPKVKWW